MGLTFVTRSTVKWPSIFVFLVMLFIAETQMNNGFTIWAEASAASVQSILVGGPLFAALTAWQTGSILRSPIREQLVLAQDQGYKAWVQIYLGNLFWASATYLSVVLLIHMQLLGRASWGSPTWIWISSSVVAMALHVAFGLLAGFISSGFLAPLITATAMYVLDGALLVTNSNPLTYLSPGYSQVQEVAFGINFLMLEFQAVWYLGAALVVLTLASFYIQGSTKKKLASLAMGLFIATVGVLGISINPGFFVFTHSSWNPLCEGEPVICVHPAFEFQESEINKALSPTVRHIDGTAFGGSRYTWTNRGVLGLPRQGEIAWHLDGLNGSWKQEMRRELATDLLTPGSESGGPCEGFPPTSQFAYSSLGSIVVNWISEEPNLFRGVAKFDSKAASQFDGYTESQKKHWLDQNVEKICDGSISASDF